MDFYCQNVGVPKSMKNKILKVLEDQGIIAEIGVIKAGILSEVYLQNVVIKDYADANWNLLIAEEVVIDLNIYSLIRGEQNVKEFRIKSGILTLPLTPKMGNDGKILRLTDIKCRVDHMDDRFRIATFSGLMECVQLSITGDVLKTKLDDEVRPRFLLSVKPLLSYIPANVLVAFSEIQNFCQAADKISEAKISAEINVPTSNIANSSVEMAFLSSNILYRGLFINTFAVNCKINRQEVILSDFRFKFDNDEYLTGNFNIDIPHNEVSGQMSFHGYPYKLLKTAAPHVLSNSAFLLPSFKDTPMSATIRLNPSLLTDVTNWNVEGSITMSEIKLGEASIVSLNGNGKLKDRKIDFNDFRIRISPNIDIDMFGSYSITDKELLLNAEINGDPNFIADLSTNEKFKTKYRKVWKEYEWNDNLKPYFKLDLYHNPKAPKSGILIAMNSKMSDYVFNGVKIDQAMGDFFFDFPGSLLVINDLNLVIDGKEATVDLAFNGKNSKYDFDLASVIRPPDLLGLFHRKLSTFLETRGLAFNENPTVVAQGYFFPRDLQNSKIEITLNGTNLNYKDALLNDFEGSVEIGNNLTAISAKIDNLLYNNWTLNGAVARLSIGKGDPTISGNVDRTEGLGMVLGDTRFNASCSKEKIVVSSETERITFGEWELNGTKAESLYDGISLNSKANINNANFGFIDFDDIASDFVYENKKLVADLDVDTARIDNSLKINGIEGKLTLADNRVEMNGIVDELSHEETKGLSNNIQVDCDYSESVLNLRIAADYFNCLNLCDLNKIKVNLSFDNGVPFGDYEVGSLVWSDKITAEDIKGTFDEYSSPWSFQNHCSKIVLPFGELINVTSTGKYSGNQLKSSVSTELCKINKYTIEDVTSTVLWEKNNLSVNRIAGSLYNGRATGEVFYNYKKKEGKIWLTTVDVDLKELISSTHPSKGRQMVGKVSAKADLNLRTAPKEIKLKGQGKIFIDNGNLWKVPFLSDFLQSLSNMKIIGLVVPQGEIGEITELTGDVEFQDNKIYFPNLKTNGNLVLITADGYYWWNTRELNFRVKAKPLNPFFSKFLPEAIDPFAILLERRLSGKLDAPKWEEISAIRDLFRSKEEETISPSM